MHQEHVLLAKCHELVISERSIFELERSDPITRPTTTNLIRICQLKPYAGGG